MKKIFILVIIIHITTYNLYSQSWQKSSPINENTRDVIRNFILNKQTQNNRSSIVNSQSGTKNASIISAKSVQSVSLDLSMKKNRPEEPLDLSIKKKRKN